MNDTHQTKRHGQRRGAFVLVGVLIVLGVVAVLVLGWMRGTLSRREQARQAEQRLQAEWLAESALERAAARLTAEPTYKGEVWNIAAGELSGPDGARVEIQVTPLADRASARRVQVVADFPLGSVGQSRVTKELILQP